MKTEESSSHESSRKPISMLRSTLRCILLLCQACGALALPLSAATVNATYNSSSDVPISSASYTATGNTIEFTLNFTPQIGTSLTVIENTGPNFIQGKFDNLAHGQLVTLSYSNQNYYFTANYYAHGGRNLVLQWMNVKPAAWGHGTSGQLGNHEAADKAQVVTVNQTGALWGGYPSSGSAGGSHSLGLSSIGTVASWGLNTNGQLGNDSTAPSDIPVTVAISGVPATRTVAALAAGAGHSLALCSDGKVVSWGLNTNGQLGNNSTSQSNLPVSVNDTGALLGRTVIAISAGSNHSLALCSDGTVVSWGLNINGQLGNNSTSQSNVPVAINAFGALSGKTIIAVAAGGSHSLALCSDGSVVSWGLNDTGQLGNNSTSQSNLPVAVTNASGALAGKMVMMIAAGASHSLALCHDRSVASWGDNASGQLGNGNNSPSSVPVAVDSTGLLSGKFVIMLSAGANHSIAHCTDGTVATWGEGNLGQLGNNIFANSNIPVSASSYSLGTGGFTGVISGSSANHTLAIFAAPAVEMTNCGFNKWLGYSQSDAADPILDPDTPYNFTSYANPGTMGELLASSTLTIPGSATGAAIYEKGSSGLMLRQIFRSKDALDAAYPAGSYVMNIRTSTPNTYHVGLSIGADDYPAAPKITSITNATWENGVLKVPDPSLDVTINWHNPENDGSWFQIENTSISKTDHNPSSSFIIPGNSLPNDSIFRAAIQLMRGSATTLVSGIPDAFAGSSFHTQVRFLIQVGTPMSDGPPMYLVMKNHNQVQTSNSDPFDLPNNLPDNDLAPYSLTVESPVGGTLSGPAATSLPLLFCPESDGVIFEYLSQAFPSAETLNAAYPNGTYTFPGDLNVSLPADSYPDTAKILTVNGAPPVWNQQGQLALDPTIDNTIVWSEVVVPDFDTKGHQVVELESYDDYNFTGIEIERGPMAESPTPITSITIPKSTMTPTFTYMGLIGYAYMPVASTENAIGAYQTSNQFMSVALKPQTITFGAISPRLFPGEDFALDASTSSGLPVTYEITSGPATVSGSTVTLTGTGTVTIRASQSGTGVYASAMSVTKSFEVAPASDLVEFRSTYGLATDGSEDLLTPANDGVPNLLKYAFNMIGAGPGQVASLASPSCQIVALDGNAGLPKQEMSERKLSITFIRRKALSNPGLTYEVQFSNLMTADSWSVNALASEVATSINETFERVTVTDNSALTMRFAKVIVTAN